MSRKTKEVYVSWITAAVLDAGLRIRQSCRTCPEIFTFIDADGTERRATGDMVEAAIFKAVPKVFSPKKKAQQ